MVAPVTEAGIGVWLKNVCSILKKNHDITLLTSSFPGVEVPCNSIIELPSWKFPNSLYRYMPKLKNLLTSGFFNNFDIIHLHGFSVYATDFILKHKDRISTPILLSVHGNLQNQKMNILRKIHDIYALRNKNKIQHIIAVSQAEVDRLIELGFDKNKITLAYNGVTVKNIERHQNEEMILYLGRLAPTKNIELLLEAFHHSKFKESNLVIAGKDFGSLTKLKKLTKKFNIEQRVSFLGEISEDKKYNLLSRASIFVHPSLTDIFSLTLLEAASVGVPCIAFDINGINEIFSEEKTGILVTPNDVMSLSTSIDLIFSDPILSSEISENSKKIIPKKFSWDKTVKILETIYRTF